MRKDRGQYMSSFFAGTIAGASGIMVGHPFDTLKVRYQVGYNVKLQNIAMATNTNMTLFQSISDLYRGITPPLLTAGAVQSINFSLYENFKRILKSSHSENISLSHVQTVFVAGTMSGTLISIITSPISCIKVQQQLSTTKGILACSKQMYQQYGIKSFYRGFSPFFIMESYGRGIYLYVYESTKLQLHQRNHSRIVNYNNKDTLPIRMISAVAAGCLSWLSIYPLDVIKSRMQLDIKGERFSSAIECIKFIYQQHGIKGFFRGLSFTMIRAAPVASTILPVYEFTKDQLDAIIVKP